MEFQRRALEVWRVVLRPVVAYLAAVLASALAFILLYAAFGDAFTRRDYTLIAELALWIVPGAAVLGVLPAGLCLMIIRYSKIRRGFADVIFGGLIGTLPAAIGLSWTIIDSPPLSRQDIEFFAEIYGSFTYAGAVGGLAYWMAIGLPDWSPPIR